MLNGKMSNSRKMEVYAVEGVLFQTFITMFKIYHIKPKLGRKIFKSLYKSLKYNPEIGTGYIK